MTAAMSRILTFLILLVLTLPVRALDDAELAAIGRRVWKNECGGTAKVSRRGIPGRTLPHSASGISSGTRKA